MLHGEAQSSDLYSEEVWGGGGGGRAALMLLCRSAPWHSPQVQLRVRGLSVSTGDRPSGNEIGGTFYRALRLCLSCSGDISTIMVKCGPLRHPQNCAGPS